MTSIKLEEVSAWQASIKLLFLPAELVCTVHSRLAKYRCEEESTVSKNLTRRSFLRATVGVVGVSAAGSLLAACSAPAAAPTTAPAAKATEAPKPAATTAPAPAATTAPAPAATSAPAQAGKKIAAKLGHIAAADQPHGLAAQKLADLARQYSGGTVDIQVFPSSQIGAEPQLLQGVIAGSIEMALQGEGTLAQPVPQYHWPTVAFMLKGPEHYEKVLKSDIPKELAELVAKNTQGNVRVLGDWYRSARQMGHRSKPIKSPADAKGAKLRVAEVPMYIDTYRELGFAVTPMNWGELYGALQQGVVEMAEAQMEWFWASKLYEVQKYLMLTSHCYGDYVVECNEKWWQGIGKEAQDAIARATKEAGDFNMQEVKKWDAQLADQLAGKGMTVIKAAEIDRAAFEKIVIEKSIPRYEEKWGKGFYDKIMKFA